MVNAMMRKHTKRTGSDRKKRICKNIAIGGLCVAMAAGLITPSLGMNTVQAEENRTGQSDMERNVEALDRGATAIKVKNGVLRM